MKQITWASTLSLVKNYKTKGSLKSAPEMTLWRTSEVIKPILGLPRVSVRIFAGGVLISRFHCTSFFCFLGRTSWRRRAADDPCWCDQDRHVGNPFFNQGRELFLSNPGLALPNIARSFLGGAASNMIWWKRNMGRYPIRERQAKQHEQLRKKKTLNF